jgi:hypothetical protein
MADNTTLQTTVATPPSGLVVATVEEASTNAHVERVLVGGGQTATHSNVAASATNVTVLAANSDRMGASVYNDGSAILYLKLAATASLTSFAIAIGPGGYYEVPFGYRGIIDGIWDVAIGSARVVEHTG